MAKFSKSAQDNRANQLNPTHPAYHRSRGAAPGEAQRMAGQSKPAADNRANQLNPNNDACEASRDESQGLTKSPEPSSARPK